MRVVLAALRFPADAPFDVVPVSADQLKARAPHEVQKPETMNYRTMAPEPGGLFDPKLFGPGTVIDAPVPRDDDLLRPRKTWFARVALATPMIHPLLIEHARAQLGELANRDDASIAAAAKDLDANRELVAALEEKHAWTILRELAVMPPDLRPLKLDEHMRWVLTPINSWYQRIVSRNARIKKLLEQGAPAAQLNADWAELNELVCGLAENDETARALDPDGKPLPSLRTLAGGTQTLCSTLKEIVEQGAPPTIDTPRASTAEMARPSTAEMTAQELVPARYYIARAVLFAMGFELAPTRA